MSDLSIFKLDTQTINIKDTTARQTADSAKTLATTASGNATTALNIVTELESEKADAIISSTSGAIASFPDGAESTAKKLVVSIEPVQKGTGDPSPDNVRPISGWTGAKVTRTGKNLLPQKKCRYTSTQVRLGGETAAEAYITLKAGTYTLSVQTNKPVTCYYTIVGQRNISIGANGGTFTLSEESKLVIYCYKSGSLNIDDIIRWQLELGSTATAYEPYSGETYDIAFPSEAGTVYGGMLDVTNGVLTVDRAQIASYAGETLPSTWISDRDVYSAGATPTTGAQVVYELATPQTYQLTPTEIRTLLGQNNVWADTGDMSVTYRADMKLYIDKKFTELQALILEN